MAGYFVVFSLQQYLAREDMKSYIKNKLTDNELEKVVVPNSEMVNGSSDFRFKDENKEFVYKGKLYDIVRQKDDGVHTVFYCINDKKEEGLFAALEEHVQRNTDQNLPRKQNAVGLVKHIVKDALPDNRSELFCHLYFTNCINSFCNSFPKDQYIQPLSPPPKG